MGRVSIAYVARFRYTDEPVLVTAAFCCPFCLRRASSVAIGPSGGDGTSVADCRCDRCDGTWIIVLNATQTLRMKLHPPMDVVIG
jgi:hypothetical protein